VRGVHGVAERLSGYSVVFKVIGEGYRLRDRIALFVAVFDSWGYFLLNRLRRRPMRLCYYPLRHCLIKNDSGMFHCRASTNDALIVSQTHEEQLRPYFDEFREGCFVDVGAHVGKYAVQLGRQLKDSGGRVVAVEAHPQNSAALEANVKLNGLSNVIVLNIACWHENGEVRLYRDSSSTASTAHSLVEEFQGSHVSVEARKLDDVLRELDVDVVDLMKLDVEGAEAECLRGAEELLRSNKIRRLLFECATPDLERECRSILEHYGYAVRDAGMSYLLAEPDVGR
jgi:FkbM family methyltransferase